MTSVSVLYFIHKPQQRLSLRGQRFSKCNILTFAGLRAVFKTNINRSTISHNYTLHLLLTVARSDRRHVKATTSTQISSLYHIHCLLPRQAMPKALQPSTRKRQEEAAVFILYLNCFGAPACAGVKCFGDSPVVHLSCLTFITPLHPLALLLLLFLWVVDADGELASLCAVLVLDQEGVFTRVRRGDTGNCDAGKLPGLELEFVAVIGHQLLVVLRPAHLRHRLAPDIASQVQGLKKEREGCRWITVCHIKLNSTGFRGKRNSKE